MTTPAALLRIAPGQRVLFASDLHLNPADSATATLALNAIDRHSPGAAHLFLLGDLFEMWVGDDGADDLAERLAGLLRGLAARGTRIWLMRGNRDFLLDVPLPDAGPDSPDSPHSPGPFSRHCGATLLTDPCVIDLHGQPALLTHGDALCTDDTVYQTWRTTCRHPAWQQAMLARPLAERQAIGRQARDSSEAGKREMSGALMDVNQQAVDAAMDAAGVSLLIHGHTHRPAVHRWQHGSVERMRVVLTDWDARGPRGSLLGWNEGRPEPLA